MKKTILGILLIYFTLGLVNISIAQKDCAVILKEAESSFDNGNIEDVHDLLSECLKNGFNKEEKIRAYKLIINSSLFEDKKEQAEYYMLQLLKLEPEFQVNTTIDPAEFVNLFNTYRTLPVYSIGVFGGLNKSNITVKETFGVHNVANSRLQYHSSGFGYQFGLKVNRYLVKGMQLSLGVKICQNTFEYTDTIFEFSFVNFYETQTRFDIPLSFSYEIGNRKIRPFVSGGIEGCFIFDSYCTPLRTYTDNSHRDISGTDIKMNEYRKKFNFAVFGGIGANYKVTRGNIFAEIDYFYGLSNQVNTDTRYLNPELIYKYHYLDNNFTLNNIAFSVGYVYSFYKPKKK